MNNSTCFSLATFVAVTMVLALTQPAGAIDSCRVKVVKSTGVIRVDASGIVGGLKWGEEEGQETNLFFNEATCVSSGTARRCELADPATSASRTPPEDCTLYLHDGVAPCSAWVAGCTPGQRKSSLPSDGIVLWDGGACPPGFTEVTAYSDKFLVGSSTAGSEGGATAHNHSVVLTLSNHTHNVDPDGGGHTHVGLPSSTFGAAAGGIGAATSTHTHGSSTNLGTVASGGPSTPNTNSGMTATASSLPPFRTITLCRKD